MDQAEWCVLRAQQADQNPAEFTLAMPSGLAGTGLCGVGCLAVLRGAVDMDEVGMRSKAAHLAPGSGEPTYILHYIAHIN